jgi:hypothetical protein
MYDPLNVPAFASPAFAPQNSDRGRGCRLGDREGREGRKGKGHRKGSGREVVEMPKHR